MAEARRIQGELEHLPADHPTRVAHLAEVKATLDSSTSAKAQQEDVDVSLALARSRLTEFKYAVDALRTTLHGKLVTITTSREDADSFYRRDKDVASHEAPAADGPAPAPTPEPKK